MYPFDKPIKSLYFRSFVVSVLLARLHFKVIRKSLYQLTDPNLGSTHTAPDKFPTGWKTWPDTSFTRSRSVYSRCSKHLNAVWTSPKFSWVVNSKSEYRVTFTDAVTLRNCSVFSFAPFPQPERLGRLCYKVLKIGKTDHQRVAWKPVHTYLFLVES